MSCSARIVISGVIGLIVASPVRATLNDDAFADYIYDVICVNPAETLQQTCEAVVPAVGDPGGGGTGTPSQQTGNTGNLGAGELAARDKPERATTEEESSDTARLQYERLGVFGNARYRNLARDDFDLERGYGGDATVVTLGADYRATSAFLYGAAFSYASRQLDFTGGAGSVKTDTFEWLFFANYRLFDSVWIDGYLGEAWQANEATRMINFEQIAYDSRAEYDTENTQWGLALGHNSSFRSLAVEVSLQYRSNRATVEAYQESGGDDGVNLNLLYGEQDIDSETLAVTVNTAINISVAAGVLVPYVQAELINELEDEARRIRANLVLAPDATPFVITTDPPDDSYGRVSAGLQWVMPRSMSVYLDAERLVAHEYLSDWSVSAGVRLNWD